MHCASPTNIYLFYTQINAYLIYKSIPSFKNNQNIDSELFEKETRQMRRDSNQGHQAKTKAKAPSPRGGAGIFASSVTTSLMELQAYFHYITYLRYYCT